MSSCRFQFKRLGGAASIIAIAAGFLFPCSAWANSGQIIYASAGPCYRSDCDRTTSFPLTIEVMNTSSFEWGCQACPAYLIRIIPSWGTGQPWSFYEWRRDPDNPLQVDPLQPGETDATWFALEPTPPATGMHYVDVILCAPDAPAACNYIPVDQVRIPLECVEWPDLVIETASVLQPWGRPGEDLMTVSFRVRNRGPGPALWYSWVEVRLSPDETFDMDGDTTDPHVVSQLVPPLAVGEWMDFCTSGVVPNAPPGMFNVLFKCDVIDEIPESKPFGGEENNVVIWRSFYVIRAEIEITEGSFTPASGLAGTPVTVSLTIANTGNLDTGPFTTGLYFSSDGQFSRDDIRWFDFRVYNITTASPFTTTWPTKIPPQLLPGDYHIIAVADIDNEVDEYDRVNNIMDLGPFKVEKPEAALPDLVVSSPSPTTLYITPGQVIVFGFTVRNAGSGEAPPSSFGLFLSSDTRYDSGDLALVTDASVPGLQAGDTYVCGVQAAVPELDDTVYHVLAVVDIEDTVGELDETNNAAIVAVLVTQTGVRHWSLYR